MVCRAYDDDDGLRLAKVIRAHGDRKGFALALCLYQGMRREEAARCWWADFFDDEYMRVLGKGDEQRIIPVHDEVLDKLAVAPRTGLYVFPGRFGGHVSPNTVWAWVRELGAEAGVVGITPHRLRHTCLAIQNDVQKDLRATQRFAGHSKIQTTEGYTRTKATAMRAAMRSVNFFGESRGRGRPGQPGLFDERQDDEW